MVDLSNIPRDSRRVPLATKVQFKFDRFSGFISEYSSNISPTGLFIVTETPEPAGRILDLEFRLGDGFEIIKGQGEVVWTRTVADGPTRPPGMGIRFLELSAGSKELIYRIVDRYVAQGGTPFDLAGVAPAPTASEPALPPLSLEPDPFPDLEAEAGREAPGTVLPWTPDQKETPMSGGDVLPPLEPLDEIFRLDEVPAAPAQGPLTSSPFAASALPSLEPLVAPPAPAAAPAPAAQAVLPFPGSAAAFPASPPPAAARLDPFPPLDAGLDLTQAGPTVVGFDEPIPDPPSYTSWTAPAASVPAPAVDDVFASYLPQPAPLPEAPHVRPLSTLAGGASVQQPRRVFPWILLGALLAVAVAVFLVKDRVAGWIGLGGGEEEIADAGPGLPLRRPAAPAPDTTLREDMGLTSDALTTEVEPVAAPVSAPAEPVAAPPVAAAAPVSQEPPPAQPAPRPLPEVVQRKPAPAAGPAVTAIERITFEPAPGGTTVILWGNGALRAESYKTESLSGPPRALVKVLGIRKPFPLKEIAVGTSEVRRIRVGYHEESGGSLHVVLDLAGSRVRIGRVEPDGQRLRITLQAQ